MYRYLGAAASIMEPGYVTAAGAILTVEARHSSYIRASLKESPFPNAFDTPLDFVSIALLFQRIQPMLTPHRTKFTALHLHTSSVAAVQ